MTIKERINSDLKIALLAGEKDRATTLRGLKSAILNAEIASNKRDEGLDEDRLIQILNKEVKNRVESAEMYVQGGSQERANKELQEKSIITAYLPAQLSDDALSAILTEVVLDLKPSGIKDMGKVVAAVRTKAAGQADGGRIAAVVKRELDRLAS